MLLLSKNRSTFYSISVSSQGQFATQVFARKSLQKIFVHDEGRDRGSGSSIPCSAPLLLYTPEKQKMRKRSQLEMDFRAPGKGLYVVVKNFCMALPGCCLAERACLFRGLCVARCHAINTFNSGKLFRPKTMKQRQFSLRKKYNVGNRSLKK